jgi:hypothetical protein
MTSQHRSFSLGRACAAALSLVAVSAWVGTEPARGQSLGSLVVNITSPRADALVRGTITASASVTSIGQLTVAGVQFKLDGVNLGAEDRDPPYAVAWHTATASNGAHTLTAVARDVIGVRYASSPVTVTVDNVRPSVTVNQAAGQSDPTNVAPVRFTVVFSEPVSGFTHADVAVGGTTGGTKTVAVSGGPSSYQVAVSGMTSGVLTAAIGAGAAVDAAGNGNTASTSTDNAVIFDITAPAVTIDQAPGQADPTTGSPINFAVRFSEPVSGFGAADVTIGGSAGGTRTVAVTGGPVSYNVAVSGMTDGTVIATIAAGVARDAVGAGNAASTSTDNQVTFDATAPAVAITAPAAGATVRGTVAIAATASDSSGVAGVQFRLDGTDLGAEDTTPPFEVSWDSTAANDGVHSLTAVARDRVGLRRTSSPVEVTVANGPRGETRFEETDLATHFTAGWVHRVGGRPFSGGTAAISPKTDGRATFAFVGTSVKWIGFRGPQTGIALVLLDGSPVAQIDTYSPAEEVKVVLYSVEGLTHGRHELWIETTGLKNPASSDSIVVVDAFDIAPASPPPTFTSGHRVEEAAAAVRYSTGWTHGDTSAGWSGGSAATTSVPGAQATLTFTGTSVNWIGFRGPSAGIARVFVDGVSFGEVDLYEPTELQAVVFTLSGLENASHTMVVEATGLRNSVSTGAQVVVDAFDTRARIEETDPSVAFVDYWEVTVSRAWSDRTAVFTWVAGARANLTFTGSSVRWIGYRGPLGGIARIYLDGEFVAAVDTYAPDEKEQVILYEAAALSGGPHVLTVEVTGEMNILAQQPFISVDAFDVDF